MRARPSRKILEISSHHHHWLHVANTISCAWGFASNAPASWRISVKTYPNRQINPTEMSPTTLSPNRAVECLRSKVVPPRWGSHSVRHHSPRAYALGYYVPPLWGSGDRSFAFGNSLRLRNSSLRVRKLLGHRRWFEYRKLSGHRRRGRLSISSGSAWYYPFVDFALLTLCPARYDGMDTRRQSLLAAYPLLFFLVNDDDVFRTGNAISAFRCPD